MICDFVTRTVIFKVIYINPGSLLDNITCSMVMVHDVQFSHQIGWNEVFLVDFITLSFFPREVHN